jgi:hypothetical protein
VKLSVDLQDYITERHLFMASVDLNKQKKEKALSEGKDIRKMVDNESIKQIIAYTQGGYFGDSDIFLDDPQGRDCTAIGDDKLESLIFMM